MPAKAISPARDRLQSNLLVWIVLPILYVLAGSRSLGLLYVHRLVPVVLESLSVSLCFALLAWALKAATPAAAAAGGTICLNLLYGTQSYRSPLAHSALIPLIELFVITFLATRAGRNRKAARGLAEDRRGRNAGQIVANLGFAALLAVPLGLAIITWHAYTQAHSAIQIVTIMVKSGVIAALAEATADTVSSEIGQAFGGTPWMLTTFHRVMPGTDGAVTLTGTAAGVAAAAVIALTGMPSLGMSLGECTVAFAAAIAGLFFDSLLGATLERRGYIGNDLVNFTSTAFAAVVALVAMRLGPNYLLN
jgi:uncharacterized protein (TIGR00297 family)